MGVRVSADWLRLANVETPHVESLSLVVPFPPAVNNLFVNVERGRIIAPRYKEWRARAGAKVLEQARGMLPGAYTMRVVATRPDRRARDIANLEKAVSDLLVSLGIVRDDADCQSITLEWADEPPRKDADVRVWLISTTYRGLQA